MPSPDVPLAGRIEDRGLAVVLRALGRAGFEGCLALRRGEAAGWIHLAAGQVTAATSSGGDDGLGAVLVAQGRITAAECARHAEGAAGDAGLGEALVGAGLITAAELGEAAAVQALAVLHRLLGWREGDYAFEPGIPPPVGAVPVRLPLAVCVRDAAADPGAGVPDTLAAEAFAPERTGKGKAGPPESAIPELPPPPLPAPARPAAAPPAPPAAPAASAEDQARSLFQQGRELLARRNYWKAADALRQAVRLCPEEARYRHYLGIALMLMKRMHEAEEHLVAATRIDPVDANGFVYLGRMYRAGRLYRKAREAFERALALEPGNELAHEELKDLPAEAPPAARKPRGPFLKRLFGRD